MLLINGKVHTMAGAIYNPGYVWVKGEKIAGVGAMKDVPKIEQEDVILDEGSCWG